MAILPSCGTIIKRDGNLALADIGRAESVKVNNVYTIVKKDKVLTSDQGTGLRFDQKDVLGTLSISEVGEEISQGVIEQAGFYDRINVGDELFLVPSEPETADTDMSASETTSTENAAVERYVPVLADLIHSIR